MQPEITLSKTAASYIKKMLEKEQGIAFKISIKKTGCSGFSYVPSILKTPSSTDLYLEVEGIGVYIDTQWKELLQNLHVDFIEESRAGIQQKRLVFTNPKEHGRCGCGESFHI